MDERIKFFIGLDAHKDSTSVAACEASRDPARFVGTIGPDVRVLLKLLAKAGDPAQVNCPRPRGQFSCARDPSSSRAPTQVT